MLAVRCVCVFFSGCCCYRLVCRLYSYDWTLTHTHLFAFRLVLLSRATISCVSFCCCCCWYYYVGMHTLHMWRHSSSVVCHPFIWTGALLLLLLFSYFACYALLYQCWNLWNMKYSERLKSIDLFDTVFLIVYISQIHCAFHIVRSIPKNVDWCCTNAISHWFPGQKATKQWYINISDSTYFQVTGSDTNVQYCCGIFYSEKYRIPKSKIRRSLELFP